MPKYHNISIACPDEKQKADIINHIENIKALTGIKHNPAVVLAALKLLHEKLRDKKL